jgi:hypothetical protein
MDWKFAVGLGTSIFFFFFRYAVKDMPTYVMWSGIIVGFLLIVWGVLPNRSRIPLRPAFLYIACIAYLISMGFYFWISPNGAHDVIKKPTEINTEYAGLSNSQLRTLVITHTTEMRNFEKKYENQRSEIYNIYQSDPREMMNKRDINNNEEITEFHNNFLSKSRSLHLELLKRLGLEYPNWQPGIKDISYTVAVMLLDTGFVAGARPISDLANYLEDLARKLP